MIPVGEQLHGPRAGRSPGACCASVVNTLGGAVYTDPDKVRYIDHEGRYFSVAGPHLCEPSPQRTPVLFQAGTSEAGRAFAARHAEGVFVGGSDLASYRETIADLRRRAQEEGREPGDVTAFASASLVVGRTREEAQRKLEDFRRLSRAERYLAHAGGGGIDLAAHPRDAVIDDILAAQRGEGPDQTPSNSLEADTARAQVVITELVQRASTRMFDVGGASATGEARRLDRHWRNARTISQHNPVVYKSRAVGDRLLNGVQAPRGWTTGVAAPGPAAPEGEGESASVTA